MESFCIFFQKYILRQGFRISFALNLSLIFCQISGSRSQKIVLLKEEFTFTWKLCFHYCCCCCLRTIFAVSMTPELNKSPQLSCMAHGSAQNSLSMFTLRSSKVGWLPCFPPRGVTRTYCMRVVYRRGEKTCTNPNISNKVFDETRRYHNTKWCC